MAGNMVNYNAEGKWSVDSVRARYRDLKYRFGGSDDFVLEPRTYANPVGITWVYNIMDTVADGVRIGDAACIELSIDYLKDNVMGSTTGYIRERMARALKQAELTNGQKQRLSEIFMTQLRHRRILMEFREYSRLFRRIGIEPYREEIESLRNAREAYIQRAVERLLAE